MSEQIKEMGFEDVLFARVLETGGEIRCGIECGCHISLPGSGRHMIVEPVPKECLPWNQEIRGENWVLIR